MKEIHKAHARPFALFFLGVCLVAPAAGIQTGNVPQGLAAADVNGDGALDLVVTNAFDDTVSIIWGDSMGGFSPGPSINVGASPGLGDDLPREIVAVDLNGDGVIDLAVVNSGNPGLAVSPSVAVLVGLRGGGFALAPFPVLLSSGSPALSFSLAAGRVDSGERIDLIVGHFGGNEASFLENDGGFRFEEGVGIAIATAASGPAAVRLADVDLDGDLDLIAANESDVVVLAGDGEGNFGPAMAIGTGGSWEDALLSDFNNDGALDLAAIDSQQARLRVFLSVDVMGNSASIVDTALPFAAASALAAGDFNQDGLEDLAVTFFDDARVGLFLGSGDGTFGAGSLLFATGLEPRDVVARDFNGDGKTDLATANAGDQLSPTNEDVSVILSTLGTEAAGIPSPIETLDMAAGLGAGISRAAGAGWHIARGTLFIAVPAESALVEVSPAGARLATIDTSALGSPDPSDVTVEPLSGDLFFTDRATARVYRVTAEGSSIASFSLPGALRPAGVAFDPIAGRLLISDEIDAMVYSFSPVGAFLKAYGTDDPLNDLAFDPGSGLLWAVDVEGEEIQSFSFDDVQDRLEEESKIEASDLGEMLDDRPVVALALDPAAGRLFVLAPRALLVEATTGGAGLAATELGLGMGSIGADADPATGQIWLLDAGLLGTVLRFAPGGSVTVAFAVQSLSTADPIVPNGLAHGGGSIFVVGSEEKRILRYSESGTLQSEISIPWIDGLEVFGLEFDPASGRLLILSPGRIFECDLSGVLQSTLPITRARRFAGISLDEVNDEIILYAQARGEVWRFDRNGVFVSRGATPAFLDPTYRAGAGTFDPTQPLNHYLFGAASATSHRFRLPRLAISGAVGWRGYR